MAEKVLPGACSCAALRGDVPVCECQPPSHGLGRGFEPPSLSMTFIFCSNQAELQRDLLEW